MLGGEPSPEYAALTGEQYDRLMGLLDDEHRRITFNNQAGCTNEENAALADLALRTVKLRLAAIC